MLRHAARQLAARSQSRRGLRRVRVDERVVLARQAGDRLEQLARARHGEPRRERGAQPAVGARRASACASARLSSIDALRLLPAAAPAPSASASIMHLPIVARMPALGRGFEHRIGVVHRLHRQHGGRAARAAARSAASRAAARSVPACARLPSARRACAAIQQRQIVGVAAEQRLAEMDVRLDEAGQQVAAARIDDRVVRAAAIAGADRRDAAVADRHVALDDVEGDRSS